MGSVALEGFGGGSNPLNFKVICNPQPETAKENTIWVDTNRINNYYFSATQPENMVEYDLWFRTDTSSSVTFNALKKNGIQVYPLLVKQYVGGALVDKTAQTYQGGSWKSWVTYLYNRGDACEKITGGWKVNLQTYGGITGSITFNTDRVVMEQVGNENTLVTKDTIPLAGYTKLELVYKYDLRNVVSNAFARFGLVSDNTKTNPTYIAFKDFQESDTEAVATLDISEINDNAYIAVTQQFDGIVEVFEIRRL